MSTATHGTATRRSPEELRILARYAAVDLAGAQAADIIRWTWNTFGTKAVLTQSMANTALAYLINQVAPEIPVVFLDTGYHFPETVQTRDALQARTSLNIISLTPKQTIAEQDAEHGADLWQRDPDLCCKLRKVAPMEDLIQGYEAWITGMRHETAPHRAAVPVVQFDESRGVLKIAPILHWSEAQLLRYTMENDVPVNPLMYDGYPSIGCAPCTKRVAPGDDPRAGRWAGQGKNECGLHK